MKAKSPKGRKNGKPAKNKRHRNWSESHTNGRKSTAEEVVNRIHEVADMICEGYKRGQIAETMNKKYGISARQTGDYASRAKALILQEVGRPKDEHRAESFAYFQNMSHDKDAPANVRLRARELIGNLLGLDAPKRAEISGPEGGKIEIEQKVKQDFNHDEYREAFRAVIGVPATDGNGKPIHPAGADAEAGGLPGSNGQ